LGYKGNKSLLAKKLPYSQICGIKVGPSYKNGVQAITQASTKQFGRERIYNPKSFFENER